MLELGTYNFLFFYYFSFESGSSIWLRSSYRCDRNEKAAWKSLAFHFAHGRWERSPKSNTWNQIYPSWKTQDGFTQKASVFAPPRDFFHTHTQWKMHECSQAALQTEQIYPQSGKNTWVRWQLCAPGDVESTAVHLQGTCQCEHITQLHPYQYLKTRSLTVLHFYGICF